MGTIPLAGVCGVAGIFPSRAASDDTHAGSAEVKTATELMPSNGSLAEH